MKNKESKQPSIDTHIICIIKKKRPETIRQLVRLVQQESPLTEREIVGSILELHNQGKITLNDNSSPLPATLKAYILSRQSYWYWILIALAAATTTLVFTVPENMYPTIYLRYILGSVFVLFLPGYTFIKALFPKNVPISTRSNELDNIERIALSIGMSLALVPITGLLLNYTPWGIRLTPVTISLLVLTLTFATTAIIREYQAKLRGNINQHE